MVMLLVGASRAALFSAHPTTRYAITTQLAAWCIACLEAKQICLAAGALTVSDTVTSIGQA